MKGTLFSADFVKDNSGSLRLLELNTDTGITGNEISNFNFTDLISVIESNNITELALIYKPYMHMDMVNHISESISQGASTITTVSLYDEDINTIYPTSVEDSDSKFILRLAYDESAIFDSTYCKGTLGMLELFSSYGSGSHVVNYYYSSSEEFTNTIDDSLNPHNVPDVAVKTIIESHNPIDFYKIGNPNSETNSDRWSGFINEVNSENAIIQQYHYNSSSLDSNGKITSIRSFHIVYGSELNIINLHSYKGSSVFELPTDISSEYSSASYSNRLGDHHYYEYTTNYIRGGSGGMLSSHSIQMSDDSYKVISDVNVGDVVKSYYISGSPQVESNSDIINWSFGGKFIPSGSYMTSSEVVFVDEKDAKYNTLIEVKIDNDSKFCGVQKQWLIYDSSSNESYYKQSKELDSENHYFFDVDGNIIDIDEANLYVTFDNGLQLVEIDVEDTDTYIISGSTSFNSVVSHNAPCFVAGTQISLSDGTSKNVEDVKVGDYVLSYNFNSSEIEPQKVAGIGSKKVDETVEYKLEDGTILESTKDHPIYSTDGRWISMNPEYTTRVYGLETSEAKVGDIIFNKSGNHSKIELINIKEERTTVYNVKIVENNHNFFANDLLVHNRFIGCFIAGTEITLSNGDIKNIEDVVVGEEVLTYNEENKEFETGKVEELRTHDVDSIIRLTFDNSIITLTTHEHPFYVIDKGWVKAGELTELDVCLNSAGEESLVSTVEVLKESHTVYNLISVSENHNFFANGILVHNKL